ncbi:MarR family winged helix-turn-helix transcriptional regulator [Nocardia sp. R16R-3T]
MDELVRKGYAERNAHPDDARARLITLTAKGSACTRAADAAAAEFADQWASVLGDSTVAELRNVLTRVVGNRKGPPSLLVTKSRQSGLHYPEISVTCVTSRLTANSQHRWGFKERDLGFPRSATPAIHYSFTLR